MIACQSSPSSRHQINMPNSHTVRRPLLSLDLGERKVTRVAVREIAFEPSQATGRHKHPCPVICYIVEGTALVQEEGGTAREIGAGGSVYEPADKFIARFDNASSTQPMKFIAYYLLAGNEPLIEMLE
jgi:quercetin dioxygenase-like cupin family protein